MTLVALFLSMSLMGADGSSGANTTVIEKEIRYKKDTMVDLSGSSVDGEKQTPPAFFVTKKEAPNAARLLDERLKFKLLHYNDLGF